MNEQFISKREFMFALPSVIIGLSILALPSIIAKVTSYSDGWISILLAGIISTSIALITVKIAAHFPGKSFLEYGSILATKPVAILITILYILSSIGLASFITRSVAYIAQQYLFEETPMEVLGLSFLLVVMYAVAGKRVGIFRLNMLFLPIIFTVFIIVGLFNIKWMDATNYFPLFKTSSKGFALSTWEALLAFIGSGIGFFYTSFLKEPKGMTKKVLLGMSIPTIFYLFIFLCCIGIFGNIVTGNIMLPTLELARKVDIPGSIFERVDAFVYTIWIMAIFNTVTIIYDVAVMLLMLVFKKLSKPAAVMMVGPVIFFIGMFPKSMDIVNIWTRRVSMFSVILTISVSIIFYILIKWKGINTNESS